ncbi:MULTISPECIES: hypothetical protein [unclassified Paenibacillus]|uniref:hypothetical protein n=1 Tax=unclassified Paenibacillus TaxID=185978 RepID=UPI00362E8E4E
MRQIIQLTTHELEGIRFMALNLYDQRGQHADQIIKPADNIEIIEAVSDIIMIHRIETVDIETDSESVFKSFLSIPGVNVSFVLPSDLRSLHDLFLPHSIVYPMICELYLPEPIDKSQPNEKVSLWWRFLNLIGGLIKRWKQ